jgi:hypothetical protein
MPNIAGVQDMKYPKEIMTLSQLVEMGFNRKELMQIYRTRGQIVAWKGGTGGRTSSIYFSTEELERIRQSKCKS